MNMAEVLKVVPEALLRSLVAFFEDGHQKEWTVNKGDRRATIKYYKTIEF